MQLSFVLNSVRRYWWLFLAFVVLGALPGMVLFSAGEAQYESRAVILVSPPSESRVQVSFTSDPDRYVLGQVSVLRSASLAEEVANAVGGDVTASFVSASTLIEHATKTDIVDVIVATADPELSRSIADAYLDVYFDLLASQVSETRQPEIDELDSQLASIHDDLLAVDQQITAAMAPYLPATATLKTGSYAPIPGVDQVVPGLQSERAILLNQYDQVLANRTALVQLDINAKLRVTSEVVQRGTLADAPVPESGKLFVAAGIIAGAFFGLVACVFVARLSRTAVDEHQIAEVLGHPIVGEFPSSRAVGKNRRIAAEALPNRLVPFVDALAVQAEANAHVGETFTVVVVGTERSSGVTTLASALANRYAVNGSQVLLIDADSRDSELTRLFAAGDAGIPALIASSSSDGLPKRDRAGNRPNAFSPTAQHGLSVVGVGDKSGTGALRRQSLPDIIRAASANAHVVVFDGGALLDSVATVQLTQLVDAVVLAVPMRRLYMKNLSRVANQLQGRRGELLPVLVPASRRRGARSAGPGSSAALGLAGEPDIDAGETDVEAPRDAHPTSRR